MRKHTVHCGESRSNGEQGKVGDAGRPFVANSQRNELGSYKGKAREQGKGQESRATQHFSENSGLFSKWVILATSIRNPHIDLLKTYASRWQIELLFKRSKTLFRFRRIKRGSQKYAIVMTHLWVALICFASGLSALFSLRPFDFFSIFATCFA